jgi:hypothetical protein
MTLHHLPNIFKHNRFDYMGAEHDVTGLWHLW